MKWIGKGLATVGIWAGAVFLGMMMALGIGFMGPLLAIAGAVVGTLAVWNPKVLENLL